MILVAPAKINLYLHLTGRRDDGFHFIDSLFAFTDFGDRLTISAADQLELTVDGQFAEAAGDTEQNLVLRAALTLAEKATEQGKRRPGAALHLTKNLPVAAGIGGGSSDAGAALRGLVDFWELDMDPAQLAAMAAGIGADIPACVRSLPVAVSGIGEILLPAPQLPQCGIVLVNPGVATPTPDIFRKFAEMVDGGQCRFGQPQPLLPDQKIASVSALVDLLRERKNDLQAPASALVPQINQVLGLLADCRGALMTRMSGSGATCFALFHDVADARDAVTEIAARRPEWWAMAGSIGGQPDRT